MNCQEIQDLFELYWELPDDDVRRIQVRKHTAQCQDCKEIFEFWEESAELFRSSGEPEHVPRPTDTVSSLVMNRIYETEAWRIPVSERIYLISDKLRRNFTAVIACTLTLFIGSFIFSLMDTGTGKQGGAEKETIIFGLHPVASAAASSESFDVYKLPNAVASLTDPFLLRAGATTTLPDYFLALSIIGMVFTLLIMNWWSRTRA